MARQNRAPLSDRVAKAAEQALGVDGSVSAIDLFTGLGWLDPTSLRRWQYGEIDCLESAMQTSPPRIAEALELLRAWAADKGLLESEAEYIDRSLQPQKLRFSADQDAARDALYRIRWLSPALSEKKRERLAAQASKPPELVVIQPLNKQWRCHRCGGSSDLLIMATEGPTCMTCAGLADLVFLPRGDALLTRRARAKSARSAVVVRFSRARERYERQGLLVEAPALGEAEREIAVGKGG